MKAQKDSSNIIPLHSSPLPKRPRHAEITDTLNECYLHFDRLIAQQPENPRIAEFKEKMQHILEAKNIVRVMVRTKSDFNKYLED